MIEKYPPSFSLFLSLSLEILVHAHRHIRHYRGRIKSSQSCELINRSTERAAAAVIKTHYIFKLGAGNYYYH